MLKIMRLSNVLVFALLCISIGATLAINNLPELVGDVLTSAADITSGITSNILKSLPTPQGLFDVSKQLLVGYPFKYVISAINEICSAALISQKITPKYTPDIDKMNFQFRTNCDRINVPVKEAYRLWQEPQFDPNKKVVILITGWTSNINDTNSSPDAFEKAYACRGDVNFVVLDADHFVDTLYSWSAFNTEYLGAYVAKGLQELIKVVPVEDIHLIGFSLGAHIVGAAGRYFREYTNLTIPRITGLDPANPCFNEGENLSGLMRGDAAFVDVIHSNPGGLGKSDPMGDIDFYPNGLNPLPPGCLSIVCAHYRGWHYFAETIYPGNEQNFIGYRCTSLARLRDGKCHNSQATMGYAVETDKKGNYFLEVRADAPYGPGGSKHKYTMLQNCGSCPNKS